ncbi:hypothetical protein ILYODFUR_038315 [Ilyodon furcidens]|uniref:Uncharacterized protein n=1 Tax=Ilyodon furcidens TaxID=33524 RepID=A0ABV0SSS4_9TELE
MAMQKLKTGFIMHLALFDGEKEHRVPSAAAVLQDSNLFEMAGRMIGHSFLHGGFTFSGLCLPVVTVLTGGSTDTAASALTLEDCPDIDHRETIGLIKKKRNLPQKNTPRSLIFACPGIFHFQPQPIASGYFRNSFHM